MYREAGHYPANWQVCSIRVGRWSIRQICGSHFPVTKQLTHPDIHTLHSLFTLLRECMRQPTSSTQLAHVLLGLLCLGRELV